ncbi:aspartate carbamoyltransferase [Candidatus Woesearchaeota archaeon]|nr:aspartate carbamoyltransferase [Candidatus Woesearchaeota archaeon]MBW3006297.1 aspartate carbamoyltransferase [Candidatus Woesearchaeota archaeon]
MTKKDIISISELSVEDINEILQKAKELEALEREKQLELLKGKVIACLFYEPSTRTRDSFKTAIARMGASAIGFDSAESTSGKKGESLHDTIKMYDGYADMIVMRHNKDGSAKLASGVAKIPVINAGDGKNQHPTQTLLDLYTIKKIHGSLFNLNVALVGDLKYGRTVHSLAQALNKFNCRLFLVSPKSLKMPKHVTEELKNYSEHEQISDVLERADILYMTRIQRERFADENEYQKVKNVYLLNSRMLKNARPNMKVMHPLPRVNEIHKSVDDTPYAHYFEQAKNGVIVRMALLGMLLGAKW